MVCFFFGGKFGFECSWPFLFCLVWCEVNKSPTHRILVGNQRKRTTSGHGFLFFLCLLGDNSVFVQMLSGPKDLSAYFFCFLSTLDWEFSFLFLLSSTLLIENFLFLLSSEGKVHGKLGFWIKACRTAGHGICQGLASGSGIKGMSHIISMIHMQQWWLGNFMQNWSCMHRCGHSSIKFLWSCDTRAQDSFSLF